MARILVIEDEPKHQEDARHIIQEAGHEVIVASTMIEAKRLIDAKQNRPDAVITDLHFPFDEREEEYYEAVGQDYSDPNTPCGIGIIVICEKEKIPCVICTDENHHGNRIEWVEHCNFYDLFDTYKGLIDAKPAGSTRNTFTGRAERKEWAEALSQVLRAKR